LSGICGWIGGSDDTAANQSRLGRLAEGLVCAPGGPETSWSRVASGVGLAIAGAALECRHAESEGLLAALCGFPRWIDPGCAAVAEREGDGAALIEAWRRHGREASVALDNASFAIIDSRTRRALVAIDRMASRPLCYAEGPGGVLAFGTGAGAVIGCAGIDGALNHQAIFDLMYFTRIPAPETIFRGVRKLLPAQYLWYESGRTTVGRYWHMPYERPDGRNIDDLSAALREISQAAVGKAANGLSGEEVGAFLSGGLDSTAVLGLLTQHLGGPAQAFSIGFDAEGYDEMAFARSAARHFGARHHEYYVTPADVVDLMPRVASAYDEPFANTSVVPAYYCARMARSAGVKLLLAGDGGDELFGGNSRYARQKLFEMYHLAPRWLRRGLLEPLLFALPGGESLSLLRRARSYVEQANVPLPERTEVTNYYRGRDPAEIFVPDIAREIDVDYPLSIIDDVYFRASSGSVLQRLLHVDQQTTLGDDDLRKVTRMCELAGMSVAFPLLDDRVAEFSAGVPPEMMLKGLELRSFFRYAFRDFLPQSTLQKSKHGFGLPFGVWLLTYKPLQDLCYGALEALRARGIYRTGYIDGVIAEHRGGHPGYYGELIWVLAVLELWLQAQRQ